MAGTDPWTGARLDDDNDSPLGGTFLARLLTDLRSQVVPRFATVSARDAAATAATTAGMPIVNGMSCWTDDAGYWDRIGGAWVTRVTKGYVDGTSGTLALTSGWVPYPNYHTPGWDLSSDGLVSLRGLVQRTGASFTLASNTFYQFATLPGAIVPSADVSPLSFVGLANQSTWPARLAVTGGSTSLTVSGMDSGSGTMSQNTGFISLDGVSYRI